MKTTLCMLFILFCCFCTLDGFAQKAGLTIKEASNGKTFNIKKGQTFDVLFKKECIGCQFVWIVVLATSEIKLVSSTYSHKSCQNCTGGNQDHTFHFKAMKTGTVPLSFAEGDKHFFAVTIKVKK